MKSETGALFHHSGDTRSAVVWVVLPPAGRNYDESARKCFGGFFAMQCGMNSWQAMNFLIIPRDD
jgi:hypothetical protein